MKVRASVFVAPAAVAVAGWVWVALGYRLAFHGVPPETGFFKRPLAGCGKTQSGDRQAIWGVI